MKRLGFLSHLTSAVTPRQLYQDTLELIVAAEELGYDVFWVAQHHLVPETGRLPSPFPFLAVAAERTRRIRLGTAVVALSFEHPLRVAEDAAVVDHLSGGRLELGLGSASEPDAFVAFGMDQATARGDASRKMAEIQRALQGEQLSDRGTTLQPPADGLAERLWRGASSVEGARFAGERGLGLLVPRLAFGTEEPTDQAQLPMLEAYLDETRERGAQATRLGVSRSVYAADDRATAREHLRAGVERQAQALVRSGRLPAGLSEDECFRRMNLFYGHPEEVVDALGQDKVLAQASDLVVQVDPGRLSHHQTLHALERIAREVAPALGWRSAAALSV
jgi:alkanesulfonate monooxygenase SsuD/methylene tetrahydromethanopterin reductase-like flavin-dependent oxidoreductase (luciferase family)